MNKENEDKRIIEIVEKITNNTPPNSAFKNQRPNTVSQRTRLLKPDFINHDGIIYSRVKTPNIEQ